MTMRDLHSNIDPAIAIAPQTIAGAPLQSGDIDLAGFNAAQVVVVPGDIDELGASPVGAAKIDVKLEHADGDAAGSPGAYAAVALADVVGPSSVTGGVVATFTDDTDTVAVGYRGDRRFLRVTLQPTGLSNGGPVAAVVNKGHARHGPAS